MDAAGKRELGCLSCKRPSGVRADEPRTIHLRVARVGGKESRGKVGRDTAPLCPFGRRRNCDHSLKVQREVDTKTDTKRVRKSIVG